MDLIRAEKARLRERYSRLRAALPPDERERRGDEAARRLGELEAYRAARAIALFASIRAEIPTGGIARRALADGKAVAFPRVVERGGLLAFHRIESPGDLSPGAWGIPEPPSDPRSLVPIERLDLIVVPGLVFDIEGFRVGYGGGYYDRVLAIAPARVRAVGLAFDLQVVEAVPRHAVDKGVDWLVTEARSMGLAERRGLGSAGGDGREAFVR